MNDEWYHVARNDPDPLSKPGGIVGLVGQVWVEPGCQVGEVEQGRAQAAHHAGRQHGQPPTELQAGRGGTQTLRLLFFLLFFFILRLLRVLMVRVLGIGRC